MRSLKNFILSSTIVVLTACGGGGGDSEIARMNPSGLYSGNVNGKPFTVLITEELETYAITPTGLGVDKSMIINGNQISIPSLKVIEFSPVALKGGSASATVSEKSSITGVVKVNGEADTSFTLKYNPAYDTPTPIFAGFYAGQVAGSPDGKRAYSSNANFTIAKDGSIAGASEGCTFRGNITTTSKTYSKIVVVFGTESFCLVPGQTLSGIASGNNGQVVFVIENANALFFGASGVGPASTIFNSSFGSQAQ